MVSLIINTFRRKVLNIDHIMIYTQDTVESEIYFASVFNLGLGLTLANFYKFVTFVTILYRYSVDGTHYI